MGFAISRDIANPLGALFGSNSSIGKTESAIQNPIGTALGNTPAGNIDDFYANPTGWKMPPPPSPKQAPSPEAQPWTGNKAAAAASDTPDEQTKQMLAAAAGQT